jgi:hypothetical protein
MKTQICLSLVRSQHDRSRIATFRTFLQLTRQPASPATELYARARVTNTDFPSTMVLATRRPGISLELYTLLPSKEEGVGLLMPRCPRSSPFTSSPRRQLRTQVDDLAYGGVQTLSPCISSPPPQGLLRWPRMLRNRNWLPVSRASQYSAVFKAFDSAIVRGNDADKSSRPRIYSANMYTPFAKPCQSLSTGCCLSLHRWHQSYCPSTSSLRSHPLQSPSLPSIRWRCR